MSFHPFHAHPRAFLPTLVLPLALSPLPSARTPVAGEATLQKLEAAISLFNSSSSPASGVGESLQGFSRLKGKRNSLEQRVAM